MISQVTNPALIISGTHSGVGKTTVSFVLMSALAKRGIIVQPFKVGPDFIDPGYHRLATGRDSINLDLWMMGLRQVRSSYVQYIKTADVGIVEGLGALFDGLNGTRDRGSAAYFARHLSLPVLLVLDIWGMTRSAAALLRGFMDFDPRIRIAGIVLNRAGSRRHFEMVRDSLPPVWRQRLVGYLIASEALKMPERHLGLITLDENERALHLKDDMLSQIYHTLDIDRVLDIFGIVKRHCARDGRFPARKSLARIGVSRDAAFCFYYPENLNRLKKSGAELVYFSPLSDRTLPEGIGGMYIGGGYPESFAGALAENASLRREIRKCGESGMPIYAECGGLMYLGNTLTDFDGKTYPMVSLLPMDVSMDPTHLAIKYISLETRRDSIIGPRGTKARGHEFHQSRIVRSSISGNCYKVRDSWNCDFQEGFVYKNTLASYLHLHFGSNHKIAQNIVSACRRYLSETG
jgi:cobyrinic acid a,c-diamide synthase